MAHIEVDVYKTPHEARVSLYYWDAGTRLFQVQMAIPERHLTGLRNDEKGAYYKKCREVLLNEFNKAYAKYIFRPVPENWGSLEVKYKYPAYVKYFSLK